MATEMQNITEITKNTKNSESLAVFCNITILPFSLELEKGQ